MQNICRKVNRRKLKVKAQNGYSVKALGWKLRDGCNKNSNNDIRLIVSFLFLVGSISRNYGVNFYFQRTVRSVNIISQPITKKTKSSNAKVILCTKQFTLIFINC